jgi:fatty acid-binding protein DegV
LSAEEVAKKTQDRVKSVQASFIIERLDYRFKGGRCNSLQLLGANVFKVRPRIVLKDGKMVSDKKYRGPMGNVVAKYCQEVLDEFNTPDLDKVFITYSTATEEMLESARAVLKGKGFKNIYESNVGVTVASHCGENTLGVMYFNDGE